MGKFVDLLLFVRKQLQVNMNSLGTSSIGETFLKGGETCRGGTNFWHSYAIILGVQTRHMSQVFHDTIVERSTTRYYNVNFVVSHWQERISVSLWPCNGGHTPKFILKLKKHIYICKRDI